MNQSLRNILFLTIPASALMFLLAQPVITFLLQSGKYTHADTLVTASALRCLSLGIFAWSCQSLLTRGFYALQNSKVPVISGAIVSVLFVGMNAWVVRPVIQVKARIDTLTHQAEALQDRVALLTPLLQPAAAAQQAVGAAQDLLSGTRKPPVDALTSLGTAQDSLTQVTATAQAALTDATVHLDAKNYQLAVARADLEKRAERAVGELGLTTSFAATIHMVALFFLLRRRLSGLQSRRILSSVGKILLATLALCLVTWLVLAGCDTAFETSHLAPKLTAIITLLAAGLTGIGAFLGLARLLHIGELQSAIDLIRRRRAG